MNEIGIALLGLGNVGLGFIHYLRATSDRLPIRVRGVADSTGGLSIDSPDQLAAILAHKESGGGVRGFGLENPIWDHQSFIEHLRNRGVKVLVESLPTNIRNGQPAFDLIRRALVTGISVVTVDKGPLVHGFDLLMDAAREGGSKVRYSGTTGVIQPDELRGEPVIEIRGVLNGTTNYVLNEMQTKSISFGDALSSAQAAGIAEPDPSLDIEGWDTACKILILARSSMGAVTRLEEVSRIGIGAETESLIETARASGRVVRLVGRARIWQGRVRLSVAPKLVREDSAFYAVPGSSKLAVFTTKSGRSVIASGGSSRNSIAEVVHEDIRLCVT